MVDTARSVAAMLALLANNTTGDISAQDIRDMFVTLQPTHGEQYITASAATSFSDTTTLVDVAGTWTLSLGSNWDMNTNGQLRYTGTPDRFVHIAASLSMTSSANQQVIDVAIAKNGTALTPSIIQRKIGTGADVGSTALHAATTVSTNDYLTMQVRNTSWSAAQTVTINYANLFAMDMPT